MSQPNTLDELFAAATDQGMRIADLVAHAWKIGCRDGIECAAAAIETSFGQPREDMAEDSRAVVLAVSEWLKLSTFTVELPDHLGKESSA